MVGICGGFEASTGFLAPSSLTQEQGCFMDVETVGLEASDTGPCAQKPPHPWEFNALQLSS